MVDYCVCAEPINERGIYPCQHALCLSCTLKKRVLMSDDSCPYCRAPGPRVAVVQSADSPPEAATIDFHRWGIATETKDLAAELSHILSSPCPQCDAEQKSYKRLKQHVQKDHGKLLCDVCTKHEFVFSNEYQTFDSQKALHKHLDREHIRCKYCNIHFYGSTEFSRHCRQTHFGCEVCERRDPQHPRYFRSYEELAQHYADKHYACMVPSCLEDKHIVFSTQLELQNHMLEAHPGLIGNRRAFQQVDLAQLSLAEADIIETPPEAETQSALARYTARLDIAANHDADKIEQIRAANQTFLAKKVPVEVFTATYESVLKDASRPQITALLTAFSKTHSASLGDDMRRKLTFALQKRAQVEEEAYNEAHKAERRSAAASGQTRPLGPAPTPIQKFGWGSTTNGRPAAGRGLNGFDSLPQLGQSRSSSPAQSKPALKATYASAASNYKPSTRKIQGLNRLPQLPAQKTQQQQQPVRQTSVPLRSSSRTTTRFGSYLPSDHSWPTSASVSASASPLSTSRTASPTPEPASASSAPQSKSKPRLNNLPSLPTAGASGDGKKKKSNVVRIV